MYFCYIVRPGDAPEGKGPQFKPFWDGIMSYNMRGGFGLQIVGFLLILISSSLGGNIFKIFNVLVANPEKLRNVPIFLAALGALLCTLGAVWVQNFRNIADDDASIKQCRGFRAGIKGIHQSSLLDILSWAMTSILLFSFMHYFDDEWATQTVGSGSTEIFASIARTFHALSLTLYGCSFFLVENFHVEGTAEFWAWSLVVFFGLSGLLEIGSLVSTSQALSNVLNVLFTISYGCSLVFAFLWSLIFEMLVGESNVKLTQSAMRNEFYKSRNAMAYYGPQQGIELVGSPPTQQG